MNAEPIDMFGVINGIGKNDLNIDNYNYIPTVRYRDIIQRLCQDLDKFYNIHTFCPAVALSNGNMFYTSNDPNYSAIYMVSGLYRADNYFLKAYNHNDHYLITAGYHGDFLQKTVIDILENRFHVYNSYCLIRRCDDCTVIIAISHNSPILHPEKIYQETVSAIEDFSIKYFDHLIDLYVENLPGLKYARFASDAKYRATILKKRKSIKKNFLLTEREVECLYWVSRGKTSKDTSVLMKISERTVDKHKENIIKKLNVTNIVYAVREAIKAELIS